MERQLLRHSFGRAPLAGTVLTIAHALALLAVVSFHWRVGGSPAGIAGLSRYGLATALAVASMLYASRRREGRPVTAATLVALSVPALASLMLWFSLTGNYAPYDPFDRDVWGVFIPAYGTTVAAVAAVYGSYRYLIVSSVALLGLNSLVGLGTVLPHVQPSVLVDRLVGTSFVAGASVAAMAIISFRLPSGLQSVRHIAPADAIMSGLGAWMLAWQLLALPANGDYVGYVRMGLYVPSDAWGPARALATYTAIAAGGVALASALAWISLHLPNRLPGRPSTAPSS